MSKIKGLLLVIYCVIAGPDGLLISGVILLNIINTVYLKVNFCRMIGDNQITVEKANIYIIAELFIGFIVALILYLINKEVRNEGISR